MGAVRQYKREDVDTALLTMALCGGNSREAAERLKESGLGVSEQSLRLWRSSTYADRYLELCHEHAPEIEKRTIQRSQEIELRALSVTQQAIDAAGEQLEAGKAKDPAATAKNVATAYGILTQNNLVRQGKPSSISIHMDARDLLDDIRKDLGAIPSTAQEVPNTALLADVSETNARD